MSTLPWWQNSDGIWLPGHGLGARPSTVVPFPRVSRPALFAMRALEVNKRLELPRQYISKYDQGVEGACVGFAWSWAMSILNKRFYAARKLYLEAQQVDEWSDTPPEEGTSIVAAANVLMTQGHWRFARGVTFPLALFEGIQSFENAKDVDDVRHAIASGKPVVFSVPWFSKFDAPVWTDPGAGGARWWVGFDEDWGKLRGWHAICCFGARDDIQAAALVNSWGANYPIVNMPYRSVERWYLNGAQALVPIVRGLPVVQTSR